MPAYLLFDKCRHWTGLSGQPLPGGSLRFFQTDTTTPQDVYGDRDLSTNNGDTIDLDSSSRLEHECWADTTDAYFVEVYDADDVKQGEVSYVELPGGAGQAIPIPNEGEFITGDGTNLLVAEVRQVPDPSGNANKLLGTDGTDLNWVARPSDGAAGTSDTSTSGTGFTVGNKRIQWASGTGTNGGGRTQTVTLTWATPFSAEPDVVLPFLRNSSLAGGSDNMPSPSVVSKSTTGATIKWTMGELDDSGAIWNFNAAVLCGCLAIGPK